MSEFRCRDRETRVRARSQRSSRSFISLILPVSAMVASGCQLPLANLVSRVAQVAALVRCPSQVVIEAG